MGLLINDRSMKNIFAIGTIGLFITCIVCLYSCEKKVTENPPYRAVVKASVESAETKADLNESYQMLWKSGDFIDIYFPTWGEKNQAFEFSGTDGDVVASFTRQAVGEFSWSDASSALFPYAYDNHISEGNAYFHLHDSYSNYSDGKTITPLIAKMNGTAEVKFKYAAGGIKITLNGIPEGVDGVSLTCDKGITGWYNVPCDKAGDDKEGFISLNSGSQAESFVKYEFDALTKSTNMSFVFPVPPITGPQLIIDIYKGNKIVWSVSTKKAQPNIGRKDVLVMPDIDVSTVSTTTKTIYVGYISYFDTKDAGGLKVHYWGSGDAEADLTAVGIDEQKVAGASYWSGASQTFHLYKATVPIGITGFELKWNGTKKGGEGGATTSRAYIFNYDGDKVIFK